MKSPKPPRSTLTAIDLRKVREIMRAETLIIRNEMMRMRKALDKNCQDKNCQQ